MEHPQNPSLTGTVPCLTLLVLASAMFGGCSSFAPRQAVPISDITSAAESGQSSQQILSSMRTAKTVYALRGSDFVILAERGVPEQVLDELQQQFFSDVQLMAQRWYQDRLAGGPTSFFPQPVDLNNLDRGGNGMAPTTNLGRTTSASRPPGVPEWVPAHPAPPFNQRISVGDIVQMTKNSDSTPEIVATIRKSHIQPLYGDPGNVVARTRTAALTGSTYARLAQQGVALEILDALQATYLADHLEWSRLRYWNSKGSGPMSMLEHEGARQAPGTPRAGRG